MPPRPVPFALRVGTDIVSIPRIRQAISRPNHRAGSQLNAFLDRLFTNREQRIFQLKNPNFSTAEIDRFPRVCEHLAGRWAAKEAVIKAAKPRKLTLLDVEILTQRATGEMYALIRDKTFVHRSGTRRFKLGGQTDVEGDAATATTGTLTAKEVHKEAEEDENDPAGQIASISISHDRDYATAVCIAPFDTLPGDVGGEAAARMYEATEEDDVYWKQ